MSARPGPAPERGGTPTALDSLRRKSGLKKARSTSVIADMTRAEEAPAPALQVVAEPEPQAAEPRLPAPTDVPAQVVQEAPAQQAPAQQPVEISAPAPQQFVQQPAPAQQFVQQAPPVAAQPAVYAQPGQQYPINPAYPTQQPYPSQQVQLRQPPPEPEQPEKKMYRKTSFFQSKESGSRMRSAYMATRHLTGARTLSEFILAAVEREVEALEGRYNGGEQFTADPNSVPRGRPLEP